jgi:hypothetical protein
MCMCVQGGVVARGHVGMFLRTSSHKFHHKGHVQVRVWGCRLLKPLALSFGEYVTWKFLPNNNGIAHQGRAG